MTHPQVDHARGLGALISYCATALAVGTLLISAAADRPAYAADDDIEGRGLVSSGESVQRVVITLNKSRTFNLARSFSTATVGNGNIADAMPLSDRVLYVQGKRIGTTNITIFDATARVISVIDVEVAPDVSVLQQKIQASVGARRVRVSHAAGQIVLSGPVPDALSAERALSVAKSLLPEGGGVVNAMQVAASQQVMLKVRFLEVNRRSERDIGVDLFGANRSGQGFRTGQGLVGLTENPKSGATPGGIPIFQTLGTLVGAGVGAQPFGTFVARLLSTNSFNVDAVITALETKGLVRRLAEPDLVALSGDTAAFLAGGEVPVPSVQPGGTAGVPVITTEYKPFGVQLTFAPTVLADGIINLRLAPSVSEIAGFVAISGSQVPSFTKREARTTIELRDGQSFAIAGLLQAQNRRDIAQLPWIGTVPIIGTLFRSASFQQEETDLVVIVTPHLVAPAAPGQRLASPMDDRIPTNDADFFLGGQMELRREYREFVSRGTGLKGPYGHMIRVEPTAPPIATRN